MKCDPSRTYTAEEFAWLSDCDDFELVDGVPIACHNGALARYICGHLSSALIQWSQPQRRGSVFSSGAGYCCFPGRPNLVRRPWISFVRTERLLDEVIPDVDHLRIAPDLAGYVMTPLHTYEEVESNVAEFRSAGVRLIWIVSPKSRTVLIRRLDGTCDELDEDGELSGEDVLSGFTCKVAELFV